MISLRFEKVISCFSMRYRSLSSSTATTLSAYLHSSRVSMPYPGPSSRTRFPCACSASITATDLFVRKHCPSSFLGLRKTCLLSSIFNYLLSPYMFVREGIKAYL